MRRRRKAALTVPAGILRYRHKPEEIEVIVYTGDNFDEVAAFAKTGFGLDLWFCDGKAWTGKHYASRLDPGTWIARLSSGVIMKYDKGSIVRHYDEIPA